MATSLAELGTSKPSSPSPTHIQEYPGQSPFHPLHVISKPSNTSTYLPQVVGTTLYPYGLLLPPPTHSSTRILHIYYPRTDPTNFTILDAGKSSALYNIAIRTKRPHLTIASVASPTPIATATYHDSHSHIDPVVRGKPIKLDSCSALKSGYTYASPAFQGAKVIWKSESTKGIDLRCVNGNGKLLARLNFDTWNLQKCGDLILMSQEASGGQVMEEMVVMGLIMMEHRLCTRIKGLADVVAGV
ncbi:MAG: hypothetical protein Q9209_005271 [Squamulea sp. 1 TL-2023]